MPRILTPQLGRRHVVRGLVAVTAAAALPIRPGLAASEDLVATPAQTEGPVLIRPTGRATSTTISCRSRVRRRVRSARSRMSRAACSTRRARPSRAPRSRSGSATPTVATGIQTIRRGSGPSATRHFRAAGACSRATTARIQSAPSSRGTYTGRTPHIHFSISAPGRERLITQMYVAGEPQNERDGILNGIRDARRRESVIVKLETADRVEVGALAGTFDVVLGG